MSRAHKGRLSLPLKNRNSASGQYGRIAASGKRRDETRVAPPRSHRMIAAEAYATPQPSRLCRWWTAPGSFSSSSSFYLSSPSLSQSLPSRVSPFYTRRSALRLARCSKVPVIGSLSGSRLDSPSRPLTVPLLAPFLLAAGVSPCAAFFPGLAVLADASAAFVIVSHPNSIQIFYFTALCRDLRFVFLYLFSIL